jgi:hypothetical protein
MRIPSDICAMVRQGSQLLRVICSVVSGQTEYAAELNCLGAAAEIGRCLVISRQPRKADDSLSNIAQRTIFMIRSRPLAFN